MTRLLFLPLLLAISLLSAQQGAVTHSIVHVLSEQSQDQSIPHENHCDLCGAYAQIGSAIGSPAQHFDGSIAAFAVAHPPVLEYHLGVSTVFTARAPPELA